MFELEDAREHLEKLCAEVGNNCEYGEAEFQIDLLHIYSHLNRAWNGRNATDAQADDKATWREWSQFPTDLEPL